ncbi:MAG: hypothetical protein QM817_27360 [Archangium sp.]
MPKRPALPELEGDAEAIERLLDTERDLHVVFPEAYRKFIARRDAFFLPPGADLWAVERCEREGKEVIFGMTFGSGPVHLLFHLERGKQLASTVYQRQFGKLTRGPEFGDFVRDAPTYVEQSNDERERAAELLAGILRMCPVCKLALRVGQLCRKDGHIGHAADQRYVINADQKALLLRDHPLLCRAWDVLQELKAMEKFVPMGSVQVLMIGEALKQPEPEKVIVGAWKAKRLRVTADEVAVKKAIDATK